MLQSKLIQIVNYFLLFVLPTELDVSPSLHVPTQYYNQAVKSEQTELVDGMWTNVRNSVLVLMQLEILMTYAKHTEPIV
jgi:hypothetical protein